MSHYTIDYSKITDPKEKRIKATQDIKDYIGAAKFLAVSRDILKDPIPRKSFIVQLSLFAGIEGYPAEAWADLLELSHE